MKLSATIDAAVAPFVHPRVRPDAVEAAAHRAFLITRVGLSLAALASAPFALALGAAPAAWEAGALAWLSLPFVAALAVSRTGDLGSARRSASRPGWGWAPPWRSARARASAWPCC